jgi:hypothetical protein
MQTKLTSTIAALIALFPCAGFAGKNADLKPLLAKPGKAIVEEAFAGTALGKNWSAAKGEWKVAGGELTGKELAADKHAAVGALNQPNHDSIIRFSFKLDGAKGFSVSYNHAKGHLFRVNVTEAGVAVNTDKDKKDPASKAMPIGKAGAKFEQGQWYTMQVEVKGAKVAVQTDNGAKIEGGHSSLDVDKTGYRFVTKGESLRLADVKTWDVAP